MTFDVEALLKGVDVELISSIAKENSSFRGFLQGYLAEAKLKSRLLTHPLISTVEKIPDQAKQKGDFLVTTVYGKRFTIELKSMDTRGVRYNPFEDSMEGVVRLKRSDPRRVQGGPHLTDSSLPRGEFDILAVNTFAATNRWDFRFIHQRYIPSTPEDLSRMAVHFKINLSATPCLYTDISYVLKDLG